MGFRVSGMGFRVHRGLYKGKGLWGCIEIAS